MELKRILLVEDDVNDIELALSAFAKNGMADDVMVARDGAEALDLLHRRGAFTALSAGNPEFILMDLKIPKIDGLELLHEIRASEDLKLIPVIILTSSREERDVARCYELGISAYVVKSLDFKRFVAAIREIALLWSALNEAPPGTLEREKSTGNAL